MRAINPDVEREIKAALLVYGEQRGGAAKIAKQFGVSKSTVSRINKGLDKAVQDRIDHSNKAEFDKLVIDYLEQAFYALKIQSLQASNEDWLKKQTAEGISTLHQATADVALRFIAALDVEESSDVKNIDIS